MKPSSERALLLLLAAVQFTHIMDFMIMMPLGPALMRDLRIGPGQFSAFVAAYTISSGITGLVAAPFIDRFDRRNLLLCTYAGFTIATLGCALAQTAPGLLAARTLSGAFGGLSMSMVLAIIGDVVPPARRAAGIGVVMTAFAVAAAVGVPFGLQLAQWFRWQAPFFVLAGVAGLLWVLTFFRLPPLRGHLAGPGQAPGELFLALLRDANAGRALLFMVTMILGHFSILPLLSAYLVANVGLPERALAPAYFTGGLMSVFTAPLVGRLADGWGRVRVFAGLVAVACVLILAITHSGHLPIVAVLIWTGLFFVFASGRFVPGQAIMTLAVPASRRGAFMSLSGCARDLAAGFTSSLGGWIVRRSPDGMLVNYHWLGWIAVVASLTSIWLAGLVEVKDSPAATDTPRQSVL